MEREANDHKVGGRVRFRQTSSWPLNIHMNMYLMQAFYGLNRAGNMGSAFVLHFYFPSNVLSQHHFRSSVAFVLCLALFLACTPVALLSASAFNLARSMTFRWPLRHAFSGLRA